MNTFGLNPTNIMSVNAMSFDVLKMDDVEDPLINVTKLASMDLEESYFITAMEFIKNRNTEINECKMELYKSISEATETYVINEAFSLFFGKINDIIDKFLKFIASLVKRFSTVLSKIVDSNRYLVKHKKEFENFSEIDNFKFNGFYYTIVPNVPASNIVAGEFNKDLFDELYNTTSSTIGMDDVTNGINKIENFDYSDFRGKIIGKDYKISESEFAAELFKVYRSNKSETDDIYVDRSIVNKALDEFINFRDKRREIEEDNKNIVKEYDKIKKQVKEITKRNGDLNAYAFTNAFPGMKNIDNNNGYVSGDLMARVDVYIKAKCDQITQYSNIHTLAFTAKLDAIKESYIQNRSMLYTALLKIQRSDIEKGVK